MISDVMRSSFRFLVLAALCAGTSFCAQSQIAQSQNANANANAAPVTSTKLPLRVLIVSGGPSRDYNQYAIESNARYLQKLTADAQSQRILFADGDKKSRNISALPPAASEAGARARAGHVLAWLFDLEFPSEKPVYRASTLSRIDGPATQVSILQSVRQLAQDAKPGQQSLLYFTGHGSPGRKTRLTLRGLKSEDDFQNTTYAGWNDGALSVSNLAEALDGWPQDVPLIVVMVQCHSGGFANLMFEGGNPKNPVASRNFCGFFAATGERQASGCTSEVDEVDYQDFTTHFFAALSGKSREGRAVRGADWDKNGAVSMLEALAWTNLRDDSIDVPLCTSEAYLRSVFPANTAPDWVKTPYLSLLADAAPWQRATLEGLSTDLKLSGENRIQSAIDKRAIAAREVEGEMQTSNFALTGAMQRRFTRLKSALQTRFPDLRAPQNSARFREAERRALLGMQTRKTDVAALSDTLESWSVGSEHAANREAQCHRFVRAARTLFLEKKLRAEGTPAQKIQLARFRAAENRNPLR